jgi:diacylglycerol O-acyltransferase
MSTRLSSADAAWLHMDRPTNLMVINSVQLFDEPVDFERIVQIHQERLADRYPRFHERVIESRLPFPAPRWEDDPDFDIAHHVHHLALPAPGDITALQDLVGDLMTMPIDRSRPLWHAYVVDGFGDGAALISRIHHCIADGVALARVMLSLTDEEPDPPLIERADPDRATRGATGGLAGFAGPAARALSGWARLAVGAARRGARAVSSPSHAANLAGAIGRDAATAARLLLTPADAATAIKGDPGVSRRVAWSHPLPLAAIKHVAHTQDATVNDVLLAAVTGALRHYLQDHDSPVGEIQAMVPFNLRDLSKPVPAALGNKFGLVFLPLPVGTSGSYRRLVAVHRDMKTIKGGRDGAVSFGLLSLTGMVPEGLERRIIDMFTAKSTAIMTNVAGPDGPVYLAGVPIRTVLVWAPTSGHIGMSVSIYSYRGEITVGLMVDATLVPEPGEIVTRLEEELDAISALPVHARRRRRAATTARRRPRRSQEPVGG